MARQLGTIADAWELEQITVETDGRWCDLKIIADPACSVTLDGEGARRLIGALEAFLVGLDSRSGAE